MMAFSTVNQMEKKLRVRDAKKDCPKSRTGGRCRPSLLFSLKPTLLTDCLSSMATPEKKSVCSSALPHVRSTFGAKLLIQSNRSLFSKQHLLKYILSVIITQAGATRTLASRGKNEQVSFPAFSILTEC